MNFGKIPDFAAKYPETAQDLKQAWLPIYCINCYHKRETAYITPNFGPFCRACLEELNTALQVKLDLDKK